MKTNFQNLRELDKQYTPQVRGVINPVEICMVKRILDMDTMTEIELRNLRDFVVMFYSKHKDIEDMDTMLKRIDKMSAITAVIDSELIDKGYEI